MNCREQGWRRRSAASLARVLDVLGFGGGAMEEAGKVGESVVGLQVEARGRKLAEVEEVAAAAAAAVAVRAAIREEAVTGRAGCGPSRAIRAVRGQ